MSNAKTRCAIYTRKSSDEGLDQEFNSLDAQYEACAAYIASQKHEGWKRVAKRYDDGGLSGGTLKRPSFQALLKDIEAGLVDMIVVYKIDRLTRSLSDFSKIVDRLDANNASFVSVTQSFNTATSMGRLTLNMLLSFAQFEREVTAERIRDKIAASKAKGLWMGGTVPLGYDPNPDKTIRGLVVNKHEAQSVKQIFTLYSQLSNMRLVRDKAEQLGLRSKLRNYASGKRMGGAIMSKGQIHHILSNPIYIGKIKHKDKIYDGQHHAIINKELWDDVQAKLQGASMRKRGQLKDAHTKTAPLLGKIIDETGDHLTPTHTKKSGRILRYYISNRLIKQRDPTGWRLPALALEKEIGNAIIDHLRLQTQRMSLFAVNELSQLQALHNAVDWGDLKPDALLLILNSAQLQAGRIKIELCKAKLADVLGVETSQLAKDLLGFSVPFTLSRRSNQTKIVIGAFKPSPNPSLLHTLKQARFWLDELHKGRCLSEVAIQSKVKPRTLRKHIRLGLLSPKLQKTILTGNHPTHWTVSTFTKTPMPMDWAMQEAQYL